MFHYLKQALYIFKPFDRAFLSEYGLHSRMVHYATTYFNVGANCVLPMPNVIGTRNRRHVLVAITGVLWAHGLGRRWRILYWGDGRILVVR